MARPNGATFEKRRREQAKREKREEKREKKAMRKLAK